MHTPHLTLLGLRVLHKHIIIEGTVGRNTGMGLIGDLTVRGHTGIMTGRDMIGRLVVEGTMEEFAGQNMIGTITQRGKTEFKPISIPEERQVEFLWDIANPKKLCYDDLYRKLLKKYHRWSS
jgi:formylmethanofuran dehydrogenase subunit C